MCHHTENSGRAAAGQKLVQLKLITIQLDNLKEKYCEKCNFSLSRLRAGKGSRTWSMPASGGGPTCTRTSWSRSSTASTPSTSRRTPSASTRTTMSGWSAPASTSPASLYRSVAHQARHPSEGGESVIISNQTSNAPTPDMQAMFDNG